MKWLIPKKQQWRRWTAPAKSSVAGLWVSLGSLAVGVVGLAVTLGFFQIDASGGVSPANETRSFVEDGWVVVEFSVVDSGTVESGRLLFEFDTDCENDLFADLTLPSGSRRIVMDRGLNRCSGFQERWTGETVFEPVLLGGPSKGVWSFRITDLDRNDYGGTLAVVSLNMDVKTSDGVRQVFLLAEDLPVEIPR